MRERERGEDTDPLDCGAVLSFGWFNRRMNIPQSSLMAKQALSRLFSQRQPPPTALISATRTSQMVTGDGLTESLRLRSSLLPLSPRIGIWSGQWGSLRRKLETDPKTKTSREIN